LGPACAAARHWRSVGRATTALLNNVPMHVVSRNLGHSSIMVTAAIYGHLTDDAARSAALVVSNALDL
jgi:integrase